jgi:hypothetical protein
MLNIARTLYAAWNKGSNKYELPEAEIIPLGESVNEKKKLTKVTSKYTELFEHDNVPLPGFTLHKADRKNWGSLDQTWLVIDPRGFLVRITSENLEKILHVTGITEGLIQQKCIWARENTETKMQLVPVSSTTFSKALENTELLENKVDMKDVEIGDTVLLQNQLVGTYMGVASLYGPVSDYSISGNYKPQVSLRRQIIEVTEGRYHHQTNLKILKVVKKAATPMTREESIARMNGHINLGVAYFTQSALITAQQYGTRGQVRLVSASAVPKLKMSLKEITKTEAIDLFNSAMSFSDFGQLVLENSAGTRFLVDYPYIFSSNQGTSVNSFEVSQLHSINLDNMTEFSLLERRRSMFAATYNKPALNSIDKFTKFYKIEKHVKNETYV